MKLKKISYIISILVLIFLIIFFSLSIYKHKNNRNNNGLVIGNPITINENIEYNDTFTSSFMDSSYLLKLLSFDASKSNNGTIEKLSNIINKSSFVIINIGLVDIDNLIKIDEVNNLLIFNEEVLYQKSEILYSNLENIISHVHSYNKNIDLYVKKISYPYYINNDNLLNFFNIVNDRFLEISTKHGGSLA